MKPVLQVEHLSIAFRTYAGVVEAVDDVSFSAYAGETLGIVGESGCGKSVTAQAITQLLPRQSVAYIKGEVYLEDDNLLAYTEREMHEVRGAQIGMIFQDPMTTLNPVLTVGSQIGESLIVHEGLSRQEALESVLELLQLVNISSPETRLQQYPHELSGGMRQRCVIAMALACSPRVLIADEPTTALDVTTEAEVLGLFQSLEQRCHMATILISHNLGIVAQLCRRVIVMYAGQVVEEGLVASIFDRPSHPYTKGLLGSLPDPDVPDKVLVGIGGHAPDLFAMPTGCRFHHRCGQAMQVCKAEKPPRLALDKEHWVRCWLYSPERTMK